MSTATSKVTLTSSDGAELQLGWSPLPMVLIHASENTNDPGVNGYGKIVTVDVANMCEK